MLKILVIGYSSTSLQGRALVLRDAGYDVLEAEPRAALSMFLQQTPSLVVLCDSLPAVSQAIMLHDIRTFSRQIPTIAVESDRTALKADAVLRCSEQAEKMLSTVRRLLTA